MPTLPAGKGCRRSLDPVHVLDRNGLPALESSRTIGLVPPVPSSWIDQPPEELTMK